MAIVSGRVRINRPFFFIDVNGDRAEFPAMGDGMAELDGAELAKFLVLVKAGQIELTDSDGVDADGSDDSKPKTKPVKRARKSKE